MTVLFIVSAVKTEEMTDDTSRGHDADDTIQRRDADDKTRRHDADDTRRKRPFLCAFLEDWLAPRARAKTVDGLLRDISDRSVQGHRQRHRQA